MARGYRDRDDLDSERSEGNKPHSLGQAHIVFETEKSFKIFVDDLDEEVWVPKSVIHDDSECYSTKENDGEGELIVKTWFAEERGWI